MTSEIYIADWIEKIAGNAAPLQTSGNGNAVGSLEAVERQVAISQLLATRSRAQC